MKMNLIAKVKICILVIVSFLVSVNAQSRKFEFSILDETRPSVYLSYERRVQTLESCSFDINKPKERKQAYRLQLHNNTTVPINVDVVRQNERDTLQRITGTDGFEYKVLSKGTAVEVCYDVEDALSALLVPSTGSDQSQRNKLPEVNRFCRCDARLDRSRRNHNSGLWIASGSYIVFDIPERYLQKDMRIFTVFNYEWEMSKDGMRFNEPHHKVYFYASDIK